MKIGKIKEINNEKIIVERFKSPETVAHIESAGLQHIPEIGDTVYSTSINNDESANISVLTTHANPPPRGDAGDTTLYATGTGKIDITAQEQHFGAIATELISAIKGMKHIVTNALLSTAPGAPVGGTLMVNISQESIAKFNVIDEKLKKLLVQ